MNGPKHDFSRCQKLTRMGIDTMSYFVFWPRQVNKLELLAYCLHFATITKPCNLHIIDSLQFPRLTVSSIKTDFPHFSAHHSFLASKNSLTPKIVQQTKMAFKCEKAVSLPTSVVIVIKTFLEKICNSFKSLKRKRPFIIPLPSKS